MDYQKVILLLVTGTPTLYEAYADRHGETRKGKKKDTLWLLIAAACLIGLSWWLFDYHPLVTGLLILVFRFCTFDYLVHAFLKRYSENHRNINVWRYTGKSTHWHDQLAAKIDWRLRIAIRLSVFVVAVLFYLS